MSRRSTVEAMSPTRRLVAIVLGGVAIAATATACGDKIVVPENRSPFIYLVLNHTAAPTGAPVQPAFVLTVWSADSVSYLSAERFEMRRVSDGAIFDWRNTSLFAAEPTFDLGTPPRPSRANYLMSDSATEQGLGFSNLRPGDSYELLVETGEEVIRGQTTIPDTFRLSFPGGRRIVWSQAAGAAGYRVELSGDEIFFTQDTSFTVPEDVTPELVSVHALGPNVFAYLTDDLRRRAGLNTGTGVFGAIISAALP